MLWSLLRRYSLKLTFALTLLIGLQFPHFLGQYETRLDAHYIESKAQLNQYQKLADLFFNGDLNELVKKHKNSDIALFKAETKIIEALVNRTEFLKQQIDKLEGPIYQRYAFLISQVNAPLFIETQQNYEANIVLNQQAIIVGLTIATIMTLLLELLFILLPFTLKKIIVSRQQKSIN
ncbi:hypothetical protein CW745_04205 [Psychromonas sp. psych-6C06]|uniref:DUF2937 family protein n=1 Tax=Psychromonas sp. psych-6C06 TaxID=2058089 RepID=UPI000C33546D|nr:DUF2937 family protein [Psychromonas sp. psych-6C06]PKF62632.1 hypothetical protein CW745_04205 [Psychromonas sp. psych-6C06]